MDLRFSRGRRALLCIWALVALVACNVTSPPQPAAQSAPLQPTAGQAAAPATPTTVRLAVPTLDLDFTLPLAVTEKLGFLQEARLDVQVREIPTNAQIAALINRELDLITVGGALLGAARGAGMRFIYAPY